MKRTLTKLYFIESPSEKFVPETILDFKNITKFFKLGNFSP